MLEKKIIILFILTLFVAQVKAQNSYSISAGLIVPDKNSSNFLSMGYNLTDDVDIKLYQNLYLNTGLSVSFNNKNPDYRYGFDDNARLNEPPLLKEAQIELYLPAVEGIDIWLFNVNLQLNIKYEFGNKTAFSPYIKAGASFNYSILKDAYYQFTFSDGTIFPEVSFINDDYNKFNVGYNVELGLNYKFVFLGFNYSAIPEVKMGSSNTPLAFYSIKLGTRIVF